MTASITGTVEDASHSPVRGATVTVKSLETGATRTVVTNDSGQYTVPSLHLGPQEVKIEKPGFHAVVRSGVTLGVGQEAVVNAQLEVGEVVEQIAVSEQAPIVNTTTASTAGVVTEQQVKDLPLNGRSFDNLITLNPGVINYSAMKSANTSTSDGNTFTVAGRRTGENLFLLNGVEYTGSSQLAITPGGTSGYLLGIDAVREFTVMTDTYPAEYGKRAGAQIGVVTQSGTNVVHGTLFEFLRNSALDSRSTFAQTSSAPPLRQNQFGAALGGPLKKDRWFLFGNYEGYRQAQTLSSVSVVPDAQARLGSLPNSSGVYTPVANLDVRMLPYMAFWPTANGPELMAVQSSGALLPSGTAFSYNNPRQSIREDFGTTRSDYVLSEHDWFSAAYTLDDGDSLVPLADPSFASATALRSQVASLQESHVFSPTRLNNFTVGFSRAGFQLSSAIPGQVPSTLGFVNGAGPGGIVVGGGITTTGGNNTITSAGPNNAAGVWNRRNLFTLADTYQVLHGRHQISLGVWFQRVQDNEDTASRQLGQATFTSLTTFLQGTVSSFQAVPTANELGWRSLFGAWYFQDAIKLRRNLTVELGVRHEFTTGWNEPFGRAANYIPDSTGTLQTAPRVATSTFTKNNAKKLFGPRGALAWDVFGNGRTAVHAGAGIYYSLIDDLSFLLNSLPPYNGSLTYSGSLFSFTPIAPGATPPPTCGPGVPQPCATYAPQGIQPDAKTPAVAEWNLTVEQQLTRQTALRVSYVGSHGYHGLLSIDPNTVAPLICTSATCTTGGTGAARGSVTQGMQYIPVSTRPNPYLGAGFFWYTEGNSSYNALEVDVTHRFHRGLEFRANYTWSKNLDMNSGLTGAQAQNQAQMILNRFNPRLDWGPSALNVRQQAGISTLYELPFGRGNNGGITNRILGGWQVNAIGTLLSGFPFTPQVGSNRSGDGDTRNPDRPSLNPAYSGPIVLGKQSQWYNPAAFILPAVGTYGNLGRGVFEGPGMADLDVSLFKRMALSEKTALQFRAELFNVLNHVNLGTPNATVFSGTATNAAAGLITTLATTPRQIQFGLKLTF
ncbi:MAG TPA: carboxypeptidase regulatory-like domain-containing protein [Candidatus Sulfopaludibacter sp.]|nr:carboxypeptidase regulatory-like domain-containing protein [Candidatus Sulfopaludibacter sp.]